MESTPRPAVSIVIPTHSEERWDVAGPHRRLRQVADRTRPPRSSSWSTTTRRCTARARRDLAGVTVLENAYAQGVSGNRNTGAFHTQTSLIAFLDDDIDRRPRLAGPPGRAVHRPDGGRHRRRHQPRLGGHRAALDARRVPLGGRRLVRRHAHRPPRRSATCGRPAWSSAARRSSRSAASGSASASSAARTAPRTPSCACG